MSVYFASRVRNFASRVKNFASRVKNFASRVRNFASRVRNIASRVRNFGPACFPLRSLTFYFVSQFQLLYFHYGSEADRCAIFRKSLVSCLLDGSNVCEYSFARKSTGIY